jgi:hypothetical protein
MEVMGDLKKSVREGRTPEAEVSIIADKMPNYAVTPTMFYRSLVNLELMQEPAEMARRPYLGGGTRVKSDDGTWGVFFEESPEAKALRHWQRQEFQEFERELAQRWRETIRQTNLTPIKDIVSKERLAAFKSPDEILNFIDESLASNDYRLLFSALDYFEIPSVNRQAIISRYVMQGGQSFSEFAPYCAHILRVDMFFNLLVAKGFASADRPTNKVDFSYFYYLPFSHFFTSQDRLHKQFAPMLIMEDQKFIPYEDLKADMDALNTYYIGLPDNVRSLGTANYAEYPPLIGDFLTARLWDSVWGTNWRLNANTPKSPRDTSDDRELLAKIKKRMDEYKKVKHEEKKT